MKNNDLGRHQGRAVVAGSIPCERPVLALGREDVPDEADVAVAKDVTVQLSFQYEAPGKSSLTKTLCLRPSKYSERGHVILELRDCAEHEPSVMML